VYNLKVELLRGKHSVTEFFAHCGIFVTSCDIKTTLLSDGCRDSRWMIMIRKLFS